MKDGAIEQTDIRAAVFQTIPTPIVAVDGDGSVVEWNHAAEKCTGIPRQEALSTTIWEVHARIAPATIPYEQARDCSREQFQTLVAMSSDAADQWTEEYEGEILSTHGEMHHIRSEVFPLWLDHHLFLVGVLLTTDPISAEAPRAPGTPLFRGAHHSTPSGSSQYKMESAHR
ncbi:MAG: PAS domain-containing protein [Spirochaeta sp.]|jgi:PAS domain S-box-containing protein|nr:PAS domain-containing protein [Spirochaeta sp.]